MPELSERLRQHPCFGGACRGAYGRIHLPVAPRCNIQCAFCDRRYDCANESRPGVTSAVLSPEQAVERAAEAIRVEPRIRVAGIAGPGDAMANLETFETLDALRAVFPKLLLCASTNGLMLEEGLERLLRARLDTLTITMNAASTETAERIYPAVWQNGTRLPRREGARLLLERQRRALALCAGTPVTVKVNTVLIPGVNESEIGEIAALAAASGAAVMNVMPLIPCGAMAGVPAPTGEQLARARTAAGRWMPQFTHCRQCRADACGLL